ncbi:hypothetical protein S140_166 [Shewanella sp. phage 1/40]|uniref:hypothetical protein n=1 Tax=Shewanella sp. phage 1/40 TaxID=1458860 RepID=UPI0004F7C106|nr:hypothetical protein S140_166 [Shewanella sp. phage 1/40]AHK11573.1 hypothetical protein S140_166 [Shewanella sp. phage 1/40]
MARQITDLPSATTIADADRMLLRQGSISKQVPYSVIKTNITSIIDAKDATKLSITTNTNNNSGLNIDTLDTNGIYRVLNPISGVGIPAILTDIYVEVYATDTANLVQKITDVVNNESYERTKIVGVFSTLTKNNSAGLIVLSGGGVLQANKRYLLSDASTYILPNTTGLTVKKDRVELYRLAAFEPTVQVNGSNGENIKYYKIVNGDLLATDTSVLYNLFTPVSFIFNTDWEL